jgi:LPXTG-site transpeptidase (sortase) family protein
MVEMKLTNRRSGRSSLSLRILRFGAPIAVFIGVAIGSYFVLQKMNVFTDNKMTAEELRSQQLNLDTTPVTQNDKDNYTVPAANPRFISIDAAGLSNARVVGLGVDKNNQMQAPTGVYDTGWYHMPYPSQLGDCVNKAKLPGDGQTDCAAVIDGHSCLAGSGRNCAFNYIDKLKLGDQIVIERGDGTKLNYTVQKVDVVDLEDVDMVKLMKPIVEGADGLNLITCAGDWTATDTNGVPTLDKRVEVYAILNTAEDIATEAS